MHEKGFKQHVPYIVPAAVVFVVLGGALGYLFYTLTELQEEVANLNQETASTTNALSERIAVLRSETVGLSESLSSTQQNIDDVRSQVGGVEQTVGSISGTVGTLEKLSKIDQELLAKYSKVYFLNENYEPSALVNIPDKYKYSTQKEEQFLADAWPFLRRLIDAAKADDQTLYVFSSYRSFERQQELKAEYRVTYGEGANAFSADQGYSEHQLGTTVDFITTGIGGTLEDFGETSEYQWLLQNAHRFGFTLSYPEDNQFYIYEPWHWRFVGVELATYLHNNDLHFYDVDQRKIDTYLVDIFD